ncbi:MAG: hypothetical protein ACK5IP_14560 [Paracoccus sp. (in: a-proteobacteria)]
MYLNSSLSSSHLPLFGGSPRESRQELTWGNAALDLFDRPISAVSGPESPALETGSTLHPAGGAGYHDWANSMFRFREAATGNLQTAEGTEQEGNPPSTEGSAAAGSGSGTTEGGSSAPGGTAGGGNANTDGGSGSTGTGSGGGSGGSGGLFGWLFGGG